MARQIGTGQRSSRSARVAAVVGIVCVAAVAFAVPALADDESGHGSHSSSHRGDRDSSDSATSDLFGPDTDSSSPSSSETSSSDSSDSTGSSSTRKPNARAADTGSGDSSGDDNSGNGDSGNGDSSNRGSGSRDKDTADEAKPANPNLIKDTPCTKTARACVDLKTQQAWLLDKTGAVVDGPIKVSSGGPGEETPVGTFAVQWKDKTHKSSESKAPNGQPAPMPYAVFFADGGVAFHGGSLTRASAGCVHLDDQDAIKFYDTLQLGDQVQVHAG